MSACLRHLAAAVAVLSSVDIGVASQRAIALSFSKSTAKTAPDDLTALVTAGGVLYNVDVTAGTPPQKLGVQLDTGSSDLWVPAADSSICKLDFPIGLCNPSGKGSPLYNPGFDVSASSSATVISTSGFNISYGDGTQIGGGYITDTVSLAGVTVKAVQIAVATDGSSTLPIEGIMGVGFASGEATVGGNGPSTQYPTMLQSMVKEGVVAGQVYSLYLNDYESNKGSIVFGGVDTTKYQGDLSIMPMLPDPQTDIIDRVIVSWSSLTVSSGTASTTILSKAVGALLDSGSSGISVTPKIAAAIATALGLTSADDLSGLPCTYSDGVGATFTFGFNNDPKATVKVTVAQMVTPTFNRQGQQITSTNGTPLCQIAIDTGADGFAVLGDIFLRSAYAVFDLDNNKVALAQTIFNVTESNIVEWNGGSLPDSTNTNTAPVNAATAAPTGTGSSSGGSATVTSVGPTKSSAAAPMRTVSFETAALVSLAVGLFSVLGGGMLLFT